MAKCIYNVTSLSSKTVLAISPVQYEKDEEEGLYLLAGLLDS